MTIQDAYNRGNNLMATAIVALAGFAFLPEAFIEDKPMYKVDDVLMFLVGLGAIWWYKMGGNSLKRSFAPVAFTIAALVVKIGAIIVEHSDKDDVGDDMGALVLFVLATALVWWLYSRKAPADK